MADRTLGHAAYEAYVRLFSGTRTLLSWDQLRPPVRARWETIAAAVIEECGGSDGLAEPYGEDDCPIQVVFGAGPIDCTFPRGHLGPHSWALPGTSDG